jgi:hypothetical protein
MSNETDKPVDHIADCSKRRPSGAQEKWLRDIEARLAGEAAVTAA